MPDTEKILGYMAKTLIVSSWIPPVLLFIGLLVMDETLKSPLSAVCPYQPNLPAWFIATASISIIYIMLNCYFLVYDKTIWSGVHSLYGLLMTISQILGMYWVYNIFSSVKYDPKEAEYCDKTLYHFSFIIVTYPLVITGIIVVLVCYLAAKSDD